MGEHAYSTSISQRSKPNTPPPLIFGEEGSGGFLYELQVQTLTLKTHMRRGTELRCL